ncbi:uncharacterized protein AMSG_04819 [Thecamonas trahens ATCC 50062]|uniref:Uncharacterized protein n=1 Tax=Thecamonas trahens ATCC 50062 TaxID=461836 RepID=A0A0L0D835_THETB|nr:hypothetical protein AMSG_04819 [Thecamonas trahens ATCC 50062]KNC48370.1 hypothetical protein AMSG_04819 [Thecamonas trahens ATCC 50062]|eukprot:XP_013758490.1 hypothetical protein AMSG_04819 [Thecamonas trahens ATCC 50062]
MATASKANDDRQMELAEAAYHAAEDNNHSRRAETAKAAYKAHREAQDLCAADKWLCRALSAMEFADGVESDAEYEQLLREACEIKCQLQQPNMARILLEQLLRVEDIRGSCPHASYLPLARIRANIGRHADAVDLLDRALAELEPLVAAGSSPPQALVELLCTRAVVNGKLGDVDAGLADISRAKALVPSGPPMFNVLDAAGRMYAAAGLIDEAVAQMDVLIAGLNQARSMGVLAALATSASFLAEVGRASALILRQLVYMEHMEQLLGPTHPVLEDLRSMERPDASDASDASDTSDVSDASDTSCTSSGTGSGSDSDDAHGNSSSSRCAPSTLPPGDDASLEPSADHANILARIHAAAAAADALVRAAEATSPGSPSSPRADQLGTRIYGRPMQFKPSVTSP